MPNNISETLKMIMVDVDGTLLSSDRTISAANQETLNEFIDQDIYLVMNTGALPKDGYKILSSTTLGINDYTKWFIGLNGVVVYNFMTNDCFMELTQSNDAPVKEVFKKLNFKNYEVLTINDRNYLHFIINNFDTWFSLVSAIYSFFEENSNKARGAENCLNIINQFDHVSIQKAALIYFGDNINDLPVFNDPEVYCVAMENAIDDLKTIASDLTSDNSQGISDYLKNKKHA